MGKRKYVLVRYGLIKRREHRQKEKSKKIKKGLDRGRQKGKTKNAVEEWGIENMEERLRNEK